MKCPYCGVETFTKKPHLNGKLERDRTRMIKAEHDQYMKHVKRHRSRVKHLVATKRTKR